MRASVTAMVVVLILGIVYVHALQTLHGVEHLAAVLMAEQRPHVMAHQQRTRLRLSQQLIRLHPRQTLRRFALLVAHMSPMVLAIAR